MLVIGTSGTWFYDSLMLEFMDGIFHAGPECVCVRKRTNAYTHGPAGSLYGILALYALASKLHCFGGRISSLRENVVTSFAVCLQAGSIQLPACPKLYSKLEFQ